MKLEKLKIIKENLDELELQIKNAEIAAEEAQKDANGHIGAMASRYDTFKEEAQYMSAAQRIRMGELRTLWQKTKILYDEFQKSSSLHPIAGAGSLVTIIDDNDEEMSFFILFYGTAKRVACGTKEAVIIGIDSPVARSIIGLTEGDEVEIKLPQKHIQGEVLHVM